ncbi:MAG: cation transporter [Candidatus Marinimicrobia bacterium]|nr:cation transporter [Candidatus Neomarinimicrobiota bacterium]
MKKYIMKSGLFLIVIIMLSCSNNPETVLPEDWSGKGEVRIYEVFGMDCPGCHGGLEKQLNAIEGVLNSQADWTSKQVLVLVDPNKDVTDNAIHLGMQRANFTPGKRLQ